MKKILCLTDFSVPSGKAVQYAAWIAQRCHGNLTILHSQQMHLLDDENEVPANAQTLSAQKHLAERTLQTTCEQLKEKFKGDDKKSPLDCKFLVKEGLLKDNVAQLTENEHYDLIVMGTTGGGADKLEDLILGSHTVQIFQANYCPVLAIPANCNVFHLEKIVFATSCYAHDYKAIKDLVVFAQCFNSQIHIVHVSADDSPEAKHKFEEFCRPIARDISYDKLHFTRISDDDVEEGLMGFVKQTHADMVAMLLKDDSFFRKYFHQSVTEQVAYNSKVPFLVMHE